MRIIIYIDDMLILAETKEMAQEALEALIYLLECVGFRINWKKSVLEPCTADNRVFGTDDQWS